MSDRTGELFPTFERAVRALGRLPGRVRPSVLGPTVLALLRPVVSRHVWRKILRGLLVVIVVLGVIDLAATVVEGARVGLKLRSLKAAGVPLSVTDLAPKPVPASENGAKLYMQAAYLIMQRDKIETAGPQAKWEAWQHAHGWPGPGASREETKERDRLRPVYRYNMLDLTDPARAKVVERYLAEDSDALAMVKQAAARPYAWFDRDWSQGFMMVLPQLARMRELARFLGCAAITASRRGDQAEALDDLRVGFVMSRQISAEPTVVSQSVSCAVDGLMAFAAQYVIGQGPLPAEGARALEEELERIDHKASMVPAVEMQRCFVLLLFDRLARHPAGTAWALGLPARGEPFSWTPRAAWWWVYATVLRPVFYADELACLREVDRTAALIGEPTWQAAAQVVAERLPRYALVGRMVLGAMGPGLGRAIMDRNRAMAWRAMVEAALGLELYRQKRGRYPATLDALRQSGWKVAPDPFDGSGPGRAQTADLVYKPVGATYLLYSIGQDLQDDGGRPQWYQLRNLGPELPQSLSRAWRKIYAAAQQERGQRQPLRPSENIERPSGDLVWMGTWLKAEKALGK